MTDDLLPLGRAHQLASIVVKETRRAGLPIDTLIPVGGIRRYEPAVSSVDVLAIAEPSDHRDVLSQLLRLPITMVAHQRDTRFITIVTERGPVTIHLTIPDDAGAALVWHTGSSTHIDALQQRAAARGLLFRDAQLTETTGRPVRCPSEDELYAHLDLPLIPPEIRSGNDEIAAAERNAIPPLVLERHMRGDLHTHSNWSDGRDSVEIMVRAARQLGYEYVAITDHSQRAWSSRKLALDEVPQQRSEIDSLRRSIAGIEILHGIEVDIMGDGSLDFDDDVLEGFDVVLASLHDACDQERPQLTARYLKAISHPLVNVITHPANRSPGRSAGFDVDFEALFAAAVETGTAMEIDGAPGHLDMDGAVARRAVAAGVTIVIDSDCHRAEWLARQMRFGVGTARRGWIEPRHVLNTGSIDDVRAFIARKRSRG